MSPGVLLIDDKTLAKHEGRIRVERVRRVVRDDVHDTCYTEGEMSAKLCVRERNDALEWKSSTDATGDVLETTN